LFPLAKKEFLPFAILTYVYCLREREQNRARVAVAKKRRSQTRSQRGIWHLLCQSSRRRQVDLEIAQNRPDELKSWPDWEIRRVPMIPEMCASQLFPKQQSQKEKSEMRTIFCLSLICVPIPLSARRSAILDRNGSGWAGNNHMFGICSAAVLHQHDVITTFAMRNY
jgi:hypothetical protein